MILLWRKTNRYTLMIDAKQSPGYFACGKGDHQYVRFIEVSTHFPWPGRMLSMLECDKGIGVQGTPG